MNTTSNRRCWATFRPRTRPSTGPSARLRAGLFHAGAASAKSPACVKLLDPVSGSPHARAAGRSVDVLHRRKQAVLGDLPALTSTQHRPFGWAHGRLLPGRSGLCRACPWIDMRPAATAWPSHSHPTGRIASPPRRLATLSSRPVYAIISPCYPNPVTQTISNLHSPFSNLHSPFSNLHSPISNLHSPISILQSPFSNLHPPFCPYASAWRSWPPARRQRPLRRPRPSSRPRRRSRRRPRRPRPQPRPPRRSRRWR
jgi:hypothetical protein